MMMIELLIMLIGCGLIGLWLWSQREPAPGRVPAVLEVKARRVFLGCKTREQIKAARDWADLLAITYSVERIPYLSGEEARAHARVSRALLVAAELPRFRWPVRMPVGDADAKDVVDIKTPTGLRWL